MSGVQVTPLPYPVPLILDPSDDNIDQDSITTAVQEPDNRVCKKQKIVKKSFNYDVHNLVRLGLVK